MGDLQLTEQIFSLKQNQNIKEALTGALLILNIRPENRAIVLSLNRKWPITVFFMGERLWHWILSTCFGKSMIFTGNESTLGLRFVNQMTISSYWCKIRTLYIYLLPFGNYHIHGRRTYICVVKAPWYVVLQIQAFQSEKTKKTKIFV